MGIGNLESFLKLPHRIQKIPKFSLLASLKRSSLYLHYSENVVCIGHCNQNGKCFFCEYCFLDYKSERC